MNREEIIKGTARGLALLRYEIEYRQTINNYSLNMHSENLYRDMLNVIYEYGLENANADNKNAEYIDLIDEKNKIFIQVTSTKTKAKIDNTLKILETKSNFEVKILYLLDKPNPRDSSFNEWNSKYGIDVEQCLIDTKDLLKDINNLEQTKLDKIYNFFDTRILKNHTTEVVLNLVIKHILRQYRKRDINFLDDFNNTKEVDKKLEINNLNERISIEIKRGLDYRDSIEKLNDDTTMSDLQDFIVREIYREILLRHIKELNTDIDDINTKSVDELHYDFYDSLNFNKIFDELYREITSCFEIKDFNEANITWIIISYFFEICDIGAKNDNAN
ncbi:SMEK domain-containing protein [Campylobacter hyointestinalis]|uniref:SMEK domain-containing protein n=1 Tax=Campylobacter hyointestinalis TaxID=198 RepID=UPI001BD6BA2E|nr:SMEK domain-containing protein [Campylobacter hyointestinalis]MBT0611966.1 SMEK domain-containing protein [Campylobacter hyointestinalis subsp. hyointestinalis]MDY2999476.1 SMEK domain-containing protein [Campylobacter hyointestinalis]